jgi:hypothetical protein
VLWFDDYERRARVAPGLLAVLPVALLATVLGLRQNPIVSAIAGLVVAAGGPLVLAGLVRQRGLHLQRELFESWGGPPTTELLRLRHGTASEPLRDQRRASVARAAGGRLPTLDEERADAVGSDERIAAAVAVIRERTRDHGRYPIVFSENRDYGFERNMLAMRPTALLVSIGAVAALVIAGTVAVVAKSTISLSAVILGVLAVCMVGVGWWRYPSVERVRAAGARYAAALLDAAAVVDQAVPRASDPTHS